MQFAIIALHIIYVNVCTYISADTPSPSPSQATPVTEGNTVWIIVGCSGGGALIIFLCILSIAVCCCIKHCCAKRGQFQYSTLAHDRELLQQNWDV